VRVAAGTVRYGQFLTVSWGSKVNASTTPSFLPQSRESFLATPSLPSRVSAPPMPLTVVAGQLVVARPADDVLGKHGVAFLWLPVVRLAVQRDGHLAGTGGVVGTVASEPTDQNVGAVRGVALHEGVVAVTAADDVVPPLPSMASLPPRPAITSFPTAPSIGSSPGVPMNVARRPLQKSPTSIREV
jgi:hypothetical protein